MRTRSVLIAAALALGVLSGAVVFLQVATRSHDDGSSSAGAGAGSSRKGNLAGENSPGGAGRGQGAVPGDRPGASGDSISGNSGKRGGDSGGSAPGPGQAGAKGTADSGNSRAGGPKGDSSGGQGTGHPGALGPGSASILVIVEDPDGKPFEGVAVEIRGQAGARSHTTGPGGIAEIAGVPPGTYQVFVRPPQTQSLRTPRSVSVTEGEVKEIRCQIPAFDGEIFGRVLHGGEPVEGIQIVARALTMPGAGARFTFDGAMSQPVTSGSDGKFLITGLPRIEHTLTTRETAQYLQTRKPAIAGSGEPVDIELVPRNSLVIHGIVTDPAEAPVPEARVNVLTHTGGSAMTDREGRFRIEFDYQRGAVALSARKDGYTPGELLISDRDIGDQAEIEVEIGLEPLGETGDLVGIVTDSDGVGIPRQVVRLHSPSLRLTYQESSREDGAYQIPKIRVAGDYRLSVNPTSGYGDFAKSPLKIEKGTNRMDITLEPLDRGSLTGRMVNPSGSPVPRLTLWVRSLSASANVVAITGDEQGRFSADDIPAGDLYFETRAAPLISIRGVQLKAGDVLDVELLVGLGNGQLSGTVADPRGQPVAGARITMTWSTSRGSLQSTVFRDATSDAAGRYLFSGLCRGRGSLSATATGLRSRPKTIQLTGGNDETEISLQE